MRNIFKLLVWFTISAVVPPLHAGEPETSLDVQRRKTRLIARLKKALPGYAETIVDDPRFGFDMTVIVGGPKKEGKPRPRRDDFDGRF